LASDEELARGCAAGDDRSLSALYDRYRRPLYVYCARMLGEEQGARDAVQEVFLAACRRRAELPRLHSVRAWLFTVARNRCLSVLRAARPRESLGEELEAAGGTPSDELQAEEEVRLVRQALGRIPPELRETVVLREYLDLSYREIAAVLEATEGAVKSRLFKARQALRAQLEGTLNQGGPPCGANSSSSN